MSTTAFFLDHLQLLLSRNNFKRLVFVYSKAFSHYIPFILFSLGLSGLVSYYNVQYLSEYSCTSLLFISTPATSFHFLNLLFICTNASNTHSEISMLLLEKKSNHKTPPSHSSNIQLRRTIFLFTSIHRSEFFLFNVFPRRSRNGIKSVFGNYGRAVSSIWSFLCNFI